MEGTLNVQNEIKEFCWIGKDYKEKGTPIGSILAEYVLPELIARKVVC